MIKFAEQSNFNIMGNDNYTPTKERIEIIQSYIVTTARYDFNVYEKRILYRIVETMQAQLNGIKLNQRHRINKELFETYEVEMPISAFLNSEEDKNYARTKAALVSMSKKIFEFEDERVWRAIPLVMLPKIIKYESTVKFRIHEEIYDALMNFSKGFKKYELQTAFKFESAYAMRLYELLSKQRTPLTYTIMDLKLMFGVEKKYKLTADFIKRVIVTSKKELDEKSPHSFEFKPLKSGRKITAIKFFPVLIRKNQDEEFEGKLLKRQVTPAWVIERMIVEYLKEYYLFSASEIKNNIELFERAQNEIEDLLLFLSEVKAKANRAANPKGYLINAIKKRLNIENEKKRS